MSTPEKSFADYLDTGLDLEGSALESWLADLEREQPSMAQRIRAALAMRATPEFQAFLAGPSMPERSPELIRSRTGQGVDPSVIGAGLWRGASGSAHSSSSGLSPGQRVGPYELERLLGSGGMAEVWLARRADGAFKREVALKLPIVSRLRKDLEERFAREREILASLEHPNIARLYDGGIDAQGLPYLAMEYVAGAALTSWCDARQLPIAQRLTLLHQVLGAVQYAHERRVIHRDLKPSNILVNDAGEVRLLDFGVAKLLEDTEGAQLTHLYGRALTTDYASPEQLKGDALDARSDVYSAGVLLYELLTGKRPYGLNAGASAGSLERALATVEVSKPSAQLKEHAGADRGTTQEKLVHELRGDLDVITLKALAKEPSERYESAAAMAEDIRRHLQHLPITARPAPLSYRAKKFVRRNRPMIAVSALAAAVVLAIGGYELAHRLAVPTPAAAIFNPPPHSIAVLPFVNISGDKQQEYFSDGLTEELLNSLSRINELRVAARTSAFSFKGKDTDVATIARKLNVGAVLEGSVRRSAHTIRVSAQLIDAVTGFHLWSDSYDRDQGDVLQLQTDIANAVTSALRITLLGDVAARIEVGGTRNPSAFDAYLRGARTYGAWHSPEDLQSAIAEFTEAIRRDPDYALAFAARATALGEYASHFAQGAAINAGFNRAEADARKAIALAPGLAEAYLALAYVFAEGSHDFMQANRQYAHAQMLAPGNARVLRDFGRFAVLMGNTEPGLAALRRAVVLDPLNHTFHVKLGDALLFSRRYDEAIAAFQGALALDSEDSLAYADRGLAYYGRGDLQSARRSCEIKTDEQSQVCLAVIYHKLGWHPQAQAVLGRLQAARGDDVAYQNAEVYAQWGDPLKSLQWLDTAVRLRDPGLVLLKGDPLLDPLRQNPRFQAIERALQFPD